MSSLWLFLLILASPSIEHVFDGDTFSIRTSEGLSVRLRLVGIDCPEVASQSRLHKRSGSGQPLGDAAKARLSELLKAPIELKPYGNDVYGRALVEVYLKGRERKNLNLLLVEEGLCSFYRETSAKGLDRGAYLMAESKPRMGKRGIWGLPHFVTPKDYRKLLERRP